MPPRSASSNVRFGSLADPLTDISLMSASEGKADVFRFNIESLRLNVRFSPKRTLLPRRNSNFQGPLSARTGPSLRSCRIQIQPGRCPPNPVRPLRLDAAYLQNLGQQSTGPRFSSKVLRHWAPVTSPSTPPTMRVLVIRSPADIPNTPHDSGGPPIPDRVEESI